MLTRLNHLSVSWQHVFPECIVCLMLKGHGGRVKSSFFCAPLWKPSSLLPLLGHKCEQLLPKAALVAIKLDQHKGPQKPLTNQHSAGRPAQPGPGGRPAVPASDCHAGGISPAALRVPAGVAHTFGGPPRRGTPPPEGWTAWNNVWHKNSVACRDCLANG